MRVVAQGQLQVHVGDVQTLSVPQIVCPYLRLLGPAATSQAAAKTEARDVGKLI